MKIERYKLFPYAFPRGPSSPRHVGRKVYRCSMTIQRTAGQNIVQCLESLLDSVAFIIIIVVVVFTLFKVCRYLQCEMRFCCVHVDYNDDDHSATFN